ncbi:copper chaperone [Mesorhizobium huakuii]|uniref:copper chaperone n=1 Tax=Mesorhizobium huakuii TaxID=28104 RepID=UPI0024E0B9B7|nr:DUF2182 domain-containing protein [Mesorhizobium huakuii]
MRALEVSDFGYERPRAAGISRSRKIAAGVGLGSASLFGWLLLPTEHLATADVLCSANVRGWYGVWLQVRAAVGAGLPSHWVLPWLMMVLSMTPPLLIGPINLRLAGSNGWFICRIGLFVAGYAFVWLAATPLFLLLMLFAHLLAKQLGILPVAVGAGVALAWQLSPWKARALGLCDFECREDREGPRTDLRIGLVNGIGCVGACWALMLLPMLLHGDGRWLMAVTMMVLLFERLVAIRISRAGWPTSRTVPMTAQQ